MKVRALKQYRCGEPGTKFAPPKKIQALMEEHCGKHGRLWVGGTYANLHPALVKALLDDKAVERIA